MGSAGKAVVELDLDDKDFKGKAGQATAGLDSNMKKLGGTILGVVGALGVLAAAKGAVKMLTDLTKKAIEVADSFEVMEKQLTTLTKSKDKAAAFFAEIKNFAKDTPYQVKDLAQSFNMLYPVFKDKTIPMLKLIGDTAAGTGRSFQDTGSAMMRMATGDWGVEIMRQLFLVKTEFGDLFGPTGTLVGTQEEAWAKLEEILGDRFGGMMVGMMDTVQGKVSNVKDVLDSLAAAVGSELTPITKEFLDVLIETVKEYERTGQLQDLAQDIATAISENKDLILDIIALLPDIVTGGVEIVRTLTDVLGRLNEINEAWGEWTGNGLTAIETLGGAMRLLIAGMIGLRELYIDMWEGIKEGGEPTERGRRGRGPIWAPKEKGWTGKKKEDWLERAGKRVEELYGVTREAAPEYTAMGPASAVDAAKALLKSGEARDARDLELRGYSPEVIAEATGRAGVTAPAPAAGKAKKRKKIPRVEKGLGGVDVLTGEEMAGAEIELANIEAYERLEARREEAREKEKEEIEKMADLYAGYFNISSYLVEGLKSGELKQAVEDFAVGLGTRVAEELLDKLIMMGIMAILNIATGGATTPLGMGPMGRGGVIKAAGGLLASLPPRPGGYYIPFGNKIINFGEAGPEVAAFLPGGRRGQDIIQRQLMPMFNIRPQLEANVEMRPKVETNVYVTDRDGHGIRYYNKVTAGKVNKAVSVRE